MNESFVTTRCALDNEDSISNFFTIAKKPISLQKNGESRVENNHLKLWLRNTKK